jgi:hypothetical protein
MGFRAFACQDENLKNTMIISFEGGFFIQQKHFVQYCFLAV